MDGNLRMAPPKVRCAVNEPSLKVQNFVRYCFNQIKLTTTHHVQRECISEESTDVESIVERFVPQQVWNKGGNDKTAKQHQGQVVPGGN